MNHILIYRAKGIENTWPAQAYTLARPALHGRFVGYATH